VSGPVERAMAALRETAPDGYFVGGCVRDWLLGHPLKDLDVAVPDRVEQIGRQTANRLGGVFFWLRREMNVLAGHRVVQSWPLRVVTAARTRG